MDKDFENAAGCGKYLKLGFCIRAIRENVNILVADFVLQMIRFKVNGLKKLSNIQDQESSLLSANYAAGMKNYLSKVKHSISKLIQIFKETS